MTYIENAACDICEKPVHLLHDPPQPCDRVLCPECGPCECVECQAIRGEVPC